MFLGIGIESLYDAKLATAIAACTNGSAVPAWSYCHRHQRRNVRWDRDPELPTAAADDMPQRLGPFDVVGILGGIETECMLKGNDPSLGRHVLIWLRRGDMHSLSSERPQPHPYDPAALARRRTRRRIAMGRVCRSGLWCFDRSDPPEAARLGIDASSTHAARGRTRGRRIGGHAAGHAQPRSSLDLARRSNGVARRPRCVAWSRGIAVAAGNIGAHRIVVLHVQPRIISPTRVALGVPLPAYANAILERLLRKQIPMPMSKRSNRISRKSRTSRCVLRVYMNVISVPPAP